MTVAVLLLALANLAVGFGIAAILAVRHRRLSGNVVELREAAGDDPLKSMPH